MVPNGWEFKRLEDLCHPDAPITYGVLKPGEFYKGGIPLLQIKDLRDGCVLTNGLHLISPVLDEEYKRSRIINNDILISLVGTIGRIAKYRSDAVANIHRNIGRIRSVSHEYLYHFLTSSYAQNEIGGSSSGSSQSALNLSTLRSMKIPVPPLPEQKKIAQILSAWDKAITTTEQLLDNSQQQKKALMQQLLTGKKRLLDKSGVRFSGGWKCVTIGSLLKEVKRPVDWDENAEYMLLSVKRRSEGVVLREVLVGSQILTKKMNVARAGDFLISKMQIVHGASGLVTEEFDGFHVSDSYISLVPRDANKLDMSFFSWFAQQKIMYHKAYLSSYGVHIEKMTFNFKMFLQEKIAIPILLEEQRKIASLLSAANQEIAVLQKKLDALKQEKKALMQQLLTGKRRVRVEQ